MKVKWLFATFLGLTSLTLLTAYLATINLGWMNFVISMLIAAIKVSLVALFFMHIHRSKVLIKIFALGGIFWLGTLIFLTFNDYISRFWLQNSSMWIH